MIIIEKDENIEQWDQERCFKFFDKYFHYTHAEHVRKTALPAKILRAHILKMKNFFICDDEPRERQGRIFNKTRNQTALYAFNIRAKAKKGYYTEPNWNEELLNIKAKDLITHPVLIFVTQSGTYFKRLNHARGVDPSGLSNFQFHKASRIRAKAKKGYYGEQLAEVILKLTTKELTEHPIFKINGRPKEDQLKAMLEGAN